MQRNIFRETLTILVLSLWKHAWYEIPNFTDLSKPGNLHPVVTVFPILLGQIWRCKQKRHAEHVPSAAIRNLKCSCLQVRQEAEQMEDNTWKVVISWNWVIPGVASGRKTGTKRPGNPEVQYFDLCYAN